MTTTEYFTKTEILPLWELKTCGIGLMSGGQQGNVKGWKGDDQRYKVSPDVIWEDLKCLLIQQL